MKAHKRRRMAGKLATVLLTLAATIQSACSGEEPNRDGVDFFFTDAEWTEYGRRIERSNRSDFSLSVRMGEHRESVRATAHLRGSSSFGCARRNYTLNLYGKRPSLRLSRLGDRRILPLELVPRSRLCTPTHRAQALESARTVSTAASLRGADAERTLARRVFARREVGSGSAFREVVYGHS